MSSGPQPYGIPPMTAAPGMVEKVARALCLAQFADEAIHGDARCCQVGGKDGCCLEALMPQARAAIESMREPTPAMVKAVDDHPDFNGYGDDSFEWIWSVMVGAALKGEG